MKTITENREAVEERRKGFIVFICKNIYSIVSKPFDRLRYYSGIDGENEESCIEIDRDGQFKAYVNNRMNVLIMWVQHFKPKDIKMAKQHLEFFLHDMEHHFVDPYVSRDIRNAYRWMKRYIKVYPVASKKDRTQKAFEMIERIYESIGIEFPLKKNQSGGEVHAC